jgi:oxidoreductase AflY
MRCFIHDGKLPSTVGHQTVWKDIGQQKILTCTIDHIVHHLLTLWALGATPKQIQDMYEYNEYYQTPIETEEAKATGGRDLRDPVIFKECLGNNSCYADFLRFFEHQIAEKGMPIVLQEYLLNGSEQANDILCRLYSDLVHPVIHLGCGLEFQQTNIVAEALAGACVHETWPAKFLLPTEDYVRSHPEGLSRRPLLEILNSMRNDPVIRNGVKHTDPFNKAADGLLMRVTSDHLAPYLSQFRLGPDPKPEELQSAMVDLMYTCAYIVGAAQQPGKREAMDFVTLHTATLSAFYPVFLAQDFLSSSDKARLLEAGARTSAVMYAGCGSPALYADRILDYKPRRPDEGWSELIQRAIVYRDEGHAVKLVRALYSTEQLGEPPAGFPIARKDLLLIAHMGMDSIEMAFDEVTPNRLPAAAPSVMERVGAGGEMVVNNMTRWVFYSGLEKAWDHIPELKN